MIDGSPDVDSEAGTGDQTGEFETCPIDEEGTCVPA